MYQFSRALYRELAPRIATRTPGDAAGRQAAVLSSCEEVVGRMATEPHFNNPTRTLFRDIRDHFELTAQPHVHAVIKMYLGMAQTYVTQHRREAYAIVTGTQMACRGVTRKGAACQRTPTDNGYCPSHQHLVETQRREASLA